MSEQNPHDTAGKHNTCANELPESRRQRAPLGEVKGTSEENRKLSAKDALNVADIEPEADAYYASRPRGSRIGAWASAQSRPLEGRFALEKAVAEYTARYAIGEIPRPPHWSGFRIKPTAIEFWHDRAFRLHDRVRFEAEGASWTKTRLYP